MDSVTEPTEIQALPGMFAIGSVLRERYRVEGLLGLGGYGLVLRARTIDTGDVVAIKVLRADVDLDHEVIERFVREANALAQLSSTHAVRTREVGTLADGEPYIVMELLQGVDLGKRIATGPLPAHVAIDYVLQACEVLCEAHALGIVHRDLKPANLFAARQPDGRETIKVLDFGIAKGPTLGKDHSLTQTTGFLGTPAYMSPEQMRSAKDADTRSDVWSIGAVLYELVEGRLPFPADSFAELCVVIATDPPAPMTHAPQLAPIVERCLQKDPARRFRTMFEFRDALAQLSPETATTARTRPAAAREPITATKPRRRTPLVLAFAVAAAAAITIGYALYEPAEPGRATPKPVVVTPRPEPTPIAEPPRPSKRVDPPIVADTPTPEPPPVDPPKPPHVIAKPIPKKPPKPPSTTPVKCDPVASLHGC